MTSFFIRMDERTDGGTDEWSKWPQYGLSSHEKSPENRDRVHKKHFTTISEIEDTRDVFMSCASPQSNIFLSVIARKITHNLLHVSCRMFFFSNFARHDSVSHTSTVDGWKVKFYCTLEQSRIVGGQLSGFMVRDKPANKSGSWSSANKAISE